MQFNSVNYIRKHRNNERTEDQKSATRGERWHHLTWHLRGWGGGLPDQQQHDPLLLALWSIDKQTLRRGSWAKRVKLCRSTRHRDVASLKVKKMEPPLDLKLSEQEKYSRSSTELSPFPLKWPWKGWISWTGLIFWPLLPYNQIYYIINTFTNRLFQTNWNCCRNASPIKTIYNCSGVDFICFNCLIWAINQNLVKIKPSFVFRRFTPPQTQRGL